MNTRLLTIPAVLALVSFTALTAIGQGKQKQKTEKSSDKTQQITIKKSVNNEKMTIVIDGEKVTVNGKPASEWKGDGEFIIRQRSDDDNRSYGYSFNSPDVYIRSRPHVVSLPRMTYTPNVHIQPTVWNVGGPMLGVTTKENSKGAEITDVVDGSAADKAGLKEGDIITKVGDKTIANPEALSKAVKTFKPNQEVNITYLRDGKSKTISVKLGERNEPFLFNYNFPSPDQFKGFVGPDLGNLGELKEFGYWGRPRLGLRIQDTETEDGATVLDVTEDSPAEKAGFKKDDKIVEIDGKAVKDADDVSNYVNENRAKYTFPVKIMRAGSAMNLELKIPKNLKTSDL